MPLKCNLDWESGEVVFVASGGGEDALFFDGRLEPWGIDAFEDIIIKKGPGGDDRSGDEEEQDEDEADDVVVVTSNFIFAAFVARFGVREEKDQRDNAEEEGSNDCHGSLGFILFGN